MKKISSDFLYYKNFVGLIITPILIVLFVKYIMVNNVPDIVKNIIFFLLAILIIRGIRLIYKTRQVFYNNEIVLVKNHFTAQSEEFELSDVSSFKKAFTLQKQENRNLFKLIYFKENKKQTIYFFRNLDRSGVIELNVFIGLTNQKHKSN